MREIRWIFFDVGSTLVDESECYRARYEEAARGTAVSAAEFAAKADEFARQGLKGDHAAAKYFGLTLPGWRSDLERPFPDAVETLAALKSRGYRLGVIANQQPGTARRLESWGLLEYFEVIVASAEEGVAKPKPEIFLRALNRAGCRPENAVMVGDRMDNDIRPAKALGMRTVRILQGPARFAGPAGEADAPDYAVNNLKALGEIFP